MPAGRRKVKGAGSGAAELLEELEALLDRLGIRLSQDRRVEGPGGFCRVHGEARMILNSRLAASDRADLILEELGRVDLSEVHIPPALRRRIEGDREPPPPSAS